MHQKCVGMKQQRGELDSSVTEVFQTEHRPEGPSITAFERCWDVKRKNQVEKARRYCRGQQKS